MALKLYNTQSRKLEDFKPLKENEVSIYVCGPTVYDLLHVGNFRGPVFFNMVRNWLTHLDFKVTYATNFTDVDDKIIKRAVESGIESTTLAQQFIEEYIKDYSDLGLTPADMSPTVTEAMDEIIKMVQNLIDSKKAYEAGGDVFFSIQAFPEYGKLSGRKPEDMLAGARVDIDEKKQVPLDFALWKAAKPGEPSWNSQWGPGRPGWHIECSAMIQKHLGTQIDIHGGGTDLVFPHHENEIAQSEGCSGKPFVKYWLHWSMLNFGGQKMSKSVGNILSLREFIKLYNAEIYKWLMLSVHYRTICDFSDEAIHRSISGLARIYSALRVAESYDTEGVVADAVFEKVTTDAWQKITDAMNDDFGTPLVFASVFEVVRAFNTQVKLGMKVSPAIQGKALAFTRFIAKVSAVTALFTQPAAEFLAALDDMLLKKLMISRGDVDAIVQERLDVRAAKDYKKSDELRDKLLSMGIAVMDTSTGSYWEVSK